MCFGLWYEDLNGSDCPFSLRLSILQYFSLTSTVYKLDLWMIYHFFTSASILFGLVSIERCAAFVMFPSYLNCKIHFVGWPTETSLVTIMPFQELDCLTSTLFHLTSWQPRQSWSFGSENPIHRKDLIVMGHMYLFFPILFISNTCPPPVWKTSCEMLRRTEKANEWPYYKNINWSTNKTVKNTSHIDSLCRNSRKTNRLIVGRC